MDLYLIAAGMNGWQTVAGILLAAFGLGFVIFVHELGHFLVAKMSGVQCDKFFIGFDIGGYKISRKWGETEYGIGILPLGGYVKMLGQDDNPANAAKEMERAKIRKEETVSDDADAAPEATDTATEGADQYELDPRSYLAKPVWKRMAIISAGVVMNVIFAFVFAVIAYSMGVKYMPCVVSGLLPGSPAWKADIQAGDDIIQINEIRKPRFRDLKTNVTLWDEQHGVPLVIRRPAAVKPWEINLKPEQTSGLATIGILGPNSLQLATEVPPTEPGSPAALANPGFESGDVLIAADGQPLATYRDLAAVLAERPNQPIRFTVRREANDEKSGTAEQGAREFDVEVAPKRLLRLGLVMRIGQISAIQQNSPAAAAGLQPGDFIEQIDEIPIDDPMTLPQEMRRRARVGDTVQLTVRRTPEQGESERLQIPITPRKVSWLENAIGGSPMSVPELGIAYRVLNHVQAIIPGSRAEEAGIVANDVVTLAEFVVPASPAGEPAAPEMQMLAKEKIRFSETESNWPSFFSGLQRLPPGVQVKLTVRRGETDLQFELAPYESERFYYPERGFRFQPLIQVRTADSLREAASMGWQETKDSLLMVYRFLQKLGTQIPLTALGGPWTIAKGAGYSAFEGLPSLLIFLTMLSANLAVINFLPIPLLDGGHMVFLIIEGIFRRPVSEKVVVALHTIGFVFLISLMLFVIALDVGLIPRGL